MTEPSHESAELVYRIRNRFMTADEAAAEIDALTEQRVAAAVALAGGVVDAARKMCEEYNEPDAWIAASDLRQAVIAYDRADRPAPEGATPTKDYVQQAREIVDRATRHYSTEMMSEDWEREHSEIDREAVVQEIATALASGLAAALARPRCSTPSQEDTGPVSGPMVERVAAALDATPNLFLRVNKGRADGYPHEICWPGEPIVVIAAYRDHAEAVSRRGQLQLRAYASAAIAVMSSPPTDASGPGSASNTESSPTPAVAPNIATA